MEICKLPFALNAVTLKHTDINIENTHEIKTFDISEMYELKQLGKYRLTSTFNFVDETQKFTATIEFELT